MNKLINELETMLNFLNTEKINIDDRINSTIKETDKMFFDDINWDKVRNLSQRKIAINWIMSKIHLRISELKDFMRIQNESA